MSERKIILSAKDIEVKFRVRDNYLTAIRNVSLDLYDGETFAIVGESGSGKSVFTKTFTGMLESNGEISNGSIMFEGKDLTKLVTDKDWEGIRGKKISTIFQDPMTSLNPIRTIGSQITEVIIKHQGVSAEEAKAQAVEIMEKVGIKNAANRFDEYPFQYSGGMRQRIVIAIALSCHPEILICDEPTTALDVTIQAQILQLIKELQRDLKFTTVYITHDLGVVANVADRVGVMYGGQIIEYGTAEEIFFDPQHPYTWALLSSLPQLGEKGQDLYYITGTPPSLYNKILGDAFAPRNKYALKIDFVEEPPFFKVSDTHYAKTWLLDPRAPKVEKPEVINNLHEKIEKMTSKGGAFYVEQQQ
ncbi:MAG: ABC transporter ATP-binding protein [Erysipelotrichaceae bacterium]|nr:ABC transporter ATP-binding protein [Erysipelotrichaceae bacterium]